MQCNVECRLPEEDVILKEPPPRSPPTRAPSEVGSQMEIYLPQANVVYVTINFSWLKNNRLYRYNVNKVCV